MVKRLETLLDVADRFDAIVFDQYGVLHNGTSAYPEAVSVLAELRAFKCELAVLTNSGKRSALNHSRITKMGFPADTFKHVMSSGEAVWCDLETQREITSLYPITAAAIDAQDWAGDLDVTFCDDVADAQAVLLMGLPDSGNHDIAHSALDQAQKLGLPVLCANPDRAAPRADGKKVISPGTLAHAYADAGGAVTFYGKPHTPVFRALQDALGIDDPSSILMVGDSLEHDVAGGIAAGWSTAFIEGGLHANRFAHADDSLDALRSLAAAEGAGLPTFTLSILR
ncbi:TIGR01459 family HAD-type hydrolase [Marivita sp. S0852]|uniref:TIGR01459 family HAD-type hydrolase n=1 Tax=Marivita sp. S0852 TaxID=3373893 RepID=UPI0039823C30